MQVLNQFAGGGLFLEGNSKKDTRKEKVMALAVFLGSILAVYFLFGDFLSVPIIDNQPCTQEKNSCNSNELCKYIWVPCVGQTKPYKYDPITTIFFGKKTCDTTNLFRSVCVNKDTYSTMGLQTQNN